jgi:hypothetical protein
MSSEISGYTKMLCFNRMTREKVGYMGTHDNYVSLVEDESDAVDVKWESDGDKGQYLAKATSPNNRYLAVSNRDYAGWDLWANENLKPVRLNEDGTISLKEDKDIKLYGPCSSLGTNYICWTKPGDNDNSNVLVFKPVS